MLLSKVQVHRHVDEALKCVFKQSESKGPPRLALHPRAFCRNQYTIRTALCMFFCTISYACAPVLDASSTKGAPPPPQHSGRLRCFIHPLTTACHICLVPQINLPAKIAIDHPPFSSWYNHSYMACVDITDTLQSRSCSPGAPWKRDTSLSPHSS